MLNQFILLLALVLTLSLTVTHIGINYLIVYNDTLVLVAKWLSVGRLTCYLLTHPSQLCFGLHMKSANAYSDHFQKNLCRYASTL